MTPEQRLADVFVALAGSTTDSPLGISRTLTILAARSPALLGARAAAVVYTPAEHEPVQVAGSEPEVHRLEHDAAGWREGPGHDCRRARTAPAQAPLAGRPATQRWPHYAPRALGLGYRSVVALPLREHTRTIGALVLLSGQSIVSADMLALGQSLADFTAVTLQRAREADHSRTLTSQLELALTSRVIIEQAKGVLATRLSTTMDEAFVRLRNHARSHRRLVSDVAREVVEGRADNSLTDPTR
ncbi:GAF and ANTAR domain-containing protein [Streptomyces sp. TLI_146]|uniref:GAF and ANTAR domain-containing protein n=1 Tax=Streptomyces sp. TLI_146 TaxID=1938858 RepID=UPI000C7001D1|nr:GAF and ANTAR domain-containing protein [Streptomyces sp. TLI_146]PKV83090.1 GAF domain-containing protein [Streptomyces sp. TLI_146]